MSGKRIAIGVAALLATLLVYAWIDGGEQPLRPIAEQIAVPGSVQ